MMLPIDQFYVDEGTMILWEGIAVMHWEDQSVTGVLARCLSTMIDAYRHAADPTRPTAVER